MRCGWRPEVPSVFDFLYIHARCRAPSRCNYRDDEWKCDRGELHWTLQVRTKKSNFQCFKNRETFGTFWVFQTVFASSAINRMGPKYSIIFWTTFLATTFQTYRWRLNFLGHAQSLSVGSALTFVLNVWKFIDAGLFQRCARYAFLREEVFPSLYPKGGHWCARYHRRNGDPGDGCLYPVDRNCGCATSGGVLYGGTKIKRCISVMPGKLQNYRPEYISSIWRNWRIAWSCETGEHTARRMLVSLVLVFFWDYCALTLTLIYCGSSWLVSPDWKLLFLQCNEKSPYLCGRWSGG